MTKAEKKKEVKAMLTEWAKYSSVYQSVSNRIYYLYNDGVKFWFWSPSYTGVIMCTSVYDALTNLVNYGTPAQIWEGVPKLDGSREASVVKLFNSQEEQKDEENASRIIT